MENALITEDIHKQNDIKNSHFYLRKIFQARTKLQLGNNCLQDSSYTLVSVGREETKKEESSFLLQKNSQTSSFPYVDA